jgi:uncharacterized protein
MTEEMPAYLKYTLFGQVEPPRTVHIPDYRFAHQVRIWLPPSYHHTDRVYPTLWVTDNTLEIAMSALIGASLRESPEVIVVAIGCPTDTPLDEFQRRRTYDFSPAIGELTPEVQPLLTADSVGGAPRFRDFLVDELRPALAREYRMDPRDHALAGHSGGGNFVFYSLFSRPDGFTKYLISSPGSAVDAPRMEAEYAASHDDLDARVFISAGGAEMTNYGMATARIWSFTAMFAEALTVRQYPSLELTAAVLPGHGHFSAWPVAYAEGVRVLWRELIQGRSKEDMAREVRTLDFMVEQ